MSYIPVRVTPLTIEQAIANDNILRPDDVQLAAEFIRTCLHLDPAQRPTAIQIQGHEWLAGALFCNNYREL